MKKNGLEVLNILCPLVFNLIQMRTNFWLVGRPKSLYKVVISPNMCSTKFPGGFRSPVYPLFKKTSNLLIIFKKYENKFRHGQLYNLQACKILCTVGYTKVTTSDKFEIWTYAYSDPHFFFISV
jgi:hypothetical protein